LIYSPGTIQSSKTVLVDTSGLKLKETKWVNGQPQVMLGTGWTLQDATAYLETIPNPSAPNGSAPGYSFCNMPAPGSLTLGGILAIGGHGTSVPTEANPGPGLMGCISNLVADMVLVAWDTTQEEYTLQHWYRAQSSVPVSAFLVHLGRAFITAVTLIPVPNYYMQVTSDFPDMADVMADPNSKPVPPSAFGTLLDEFGRIEVIWFPYQEKDKDKAWVQRGQQFATRQGPPAEDPFNWMKVPEWLSNGFRNGLHSDPSGTPGLQRWALDVTQKNAARTLNGTAPQREIWVLDDTMLMSACGYTVQLPRGEVQAALHAFHLQFTSMLADFEGNKDPMLRYPVNGPVEIRCTTIDYQDDLKLGPNAKAPALAMTHSVDPKNGNDTVLWVEVLTFPGTPGSGPFFAALEEWMRDTWIKGTNWVLRPEWSKGWAYTESGPWTDTWVMGTWIPSVYEEASDGMNFAYAKQALADADPHKLFHNSFLDGIFGP
jgi:hypothetical protein